MNHNKARIIRLKRTKTVDGDDCIVYPHDEGDIHLNILGSLLSPKAYELDKPSFYLMEKNDEGGLQQGLSEINDKYYMLNRKSQITWPVSYYHRHTARKD